jgi:hypothetical protein
VTKELFSFGDSTYRVALCDSCADKFQRELLTWARCGELVEGEPTRTRPRKRAEAETGPTSTRTLSETAAPRRGTVLAGHVHVPVVTVPEPRSITPKSARSDDLPFGAERWSFTEHALERQEARGIDRNQALWAALAPEIARPSDRPGIKVHIRGDVQVAVSPRQRRIITVINRSLSRQELPHAASR